MEGSEAETEVVKKTERRQVSVGESRFDSSSVRSLHNPVHNDVAVNTLRVEDSKTGLGSDK